jgi:hypothetical protein
MERLDVGGIDVGARCDGRCAPRSSAMQVVGIVYNVGANKEVIIYNCIH